MGIPESAQLFNIIEALSDDAKLESWMLRPRFSHTWSERTERLQTYLSYRPKNDSEYSLPGPETKPKVQYCNDPRYR
jgi:hypothetical protein